MGTGGVEGYHVDWWEHPLKNEPTLGQQVRAGARSAATRAGVAGRAGREPLHQRLGARVVVAQQQGPPQGREGAAMAGASALAFR
jgi:hypothetical protein